METKIVRENRKMRKITVAIAALLVVFAGSGIAGASVVTLSIEINATKINEGLPNEMYNIPLVGGTATYTVYGLVTDNTTDDGLGSGADSILHGGFATYIVDQFYTSGAGQISNTGKTAPPANVGKATTTIPTLFSPYAQNGFLIDESGVKRGALGFPGIGGVVSSGGGMNMPSDLYAYYESGKKPDYEVGNGTKTVLFTGTIQAVADGIVDISVVMEKVGSVWQSNLWTVNAEGLQQLPADVVNPGSAKLLVGPPVVTNNPPEVSIPGGDVLEEDWSKEPGWNNLEHTVVITAEGVDDGKPMPPGALSYEWIMTRPGVGSVILGEDGGVLTLKLDDIKSLGPLPDYPGEIWNLSVTAFDGEKYSVPAGIGVFVPEPATIGLLSFGIVGALLRRRRRA